MRRKKNNVKLRQFDKFLFWIVVLLSVVGILAVANASAPQALMVFSNPYHFAKQQVIWTMLGFLGLFITYHIHYSYWKKVAFAIGGVSLLFLVAVLIPGIGDKFLGARRWIGIGSFSFQPSELAKFAVILVVAKMSDEKYPLAYIIGFIGLVSMLIMFQPDLGTTIVISAIGIFQLFAAGISFTSLFVIGSLASLLTGFLILTSDYRRDRLLTFLESSTDPLGKSYHMRQILIALGTGGLFGVGIGQSRQKHLFLPETASDSIFAVIAEEVGLIGSAVLILLLAFFVLRVLRVASFAPDNFSRLLASGIAFWMMAQTFLNLSSMVAITPLTGIPLPFFSYGGSSLVMILTALGIILNISKNAQT